MSKVWEEIRSWNVGGSDGSVEKYTLSKKASGGFKIQNDFGNVVIDMETMSGVEFLKKVLEEMETVITNDCDWLDDLFDDSDEDTDINNCDYTD
jgi:hypothetical protein